MNYLAHPWPQEFPGGPEVLLFNATGRSGLPGRERQVHGEVLLVGGDKFPRKKIVCGVQAVVRGGDILA